VSRVDVKAEVVVYAKDCQPWGRTGERVGVETYWNDQAGDYAVLVVGGHRYAIYARDLRVALDAVTKR
jgi:hypothetical protein